MQGNNQYFGRVLRRAEMETLDDKLVKPEVGVISSWRLFFWPVLVGMVTGGVTNYLNGVISYRYFVRVSGGGINYLYPYGDFAILGWGLLNGAVLGGVFGLLYLIFFAVRFQRMGKWGVVRRRFLKAGLVTTVVWLVSGVIGAVLCYRNPTEMANIFAFLDPRFENLPTKIAFDLIKFGYVAFAIWGTIIGSVIGLCWAIWDTLRFASSPAQ